MVVSDGKIVLHYAFSKVNLFPHTDAIIAHHPSLDPVLAAGADGIAAKAKARLAAHRRRGDSKIVVSKGWLDYYVKIVDRPTDGADPAPYRISFQHDILWGAL